MQALRVLATAFVLMLALTGVARAGDQIVLESYTGPKPEDIDRLLSPLLEELANRGYIGGYDIAGRPFEARQSRASIGPTAIPADFAAQVDLGHSAWIAGKFREATNILSPLVVAAHSNPGAFTNQSLREPLKKALIALALAHLRLGDLTAAAGTFDELVRSFPDVTVSRGSYGPDAAKSFEEAKAHAETPGRGGLQVRANNASAAIFINEHLEAVAPLKKPNLVTGEYRVFAQIGQQLSRSHNVVVKPNQTALVTINAGFDLAVQTTPRWTGLRFTTAEEREKYEAQYAAQFANGIDARAVVIVGVDQVAGHPAIIGVLVDLSGKELRRASVTLDADAPGERLKALAAFLTGEKPASGIDVQLSNDVTAPVTRRSEPAPTTPEEPARAGAWRGWKFVTGGAAVVALGVGGYLLAIDQTCSKEPPPGIRCGDLYNTAVQGWVTVGGGVVLAGVTAYLVLHKPGHAPARTAYVVPTSGGALAGFSARF